jgi:hypothetical protein
MTSPSGPPAIASKTKKKKKKKKAAKKKTVAVGKLGVLGFRVAATPRDALTEIPPVRLTLTGSGGTITDCSGAVPLPVPTDRLFATLVIVTSVSGRADLVQGTLTDPDGDSAAMTFGPTSTPTTAVVSDSSALPIVPKNGTYTIAATPSVKTGATTFKHGPTTSGSVTVDCTRP